MSPRYVSILQYNAFTDKPFAGNPAGVVTEASGLDDEVMQLIARQMNLAETAFLVPPSSSAADVRLRWFTPAQEVTLCGHATIAAFAAAAEHGVYPSEPGEERELRVETLSGILRIRIGEREGAVRVAMQIPVPGFEPLELDRPAFAALWGVGAADLDGGWWALPSTKYWYIPVRDADALRSLTLNSEALAEIDPGASFAFFTGDTVEPDSHWHLRFFAPFLGVPEDTVTGSAQGPMGPLHLRLAGAPPEDGWTELKGEQGDGLGRPGRVVVRVHAEKGTVNDLEIAGGAVAMLEGRIRI
ncbi:MAG: PhzF family phenazine biosynthesis isomerase [Gemmatimonadetes bacterium]|nr:PhzF family phenazine biosynthesis isomerase [Gemmatimonadota bacterium]NIO31285.1 PhzF family phenazine biosynthesis isomerase [Gemmatimonadota bacterium]